MEHVQPLHCIFTYIDERNMRLVSRRYGLTYIQYRVFDVGDLEFCRDVAAAIVRLYYMSEIQTTSHTRPLRTVHCPIIFGIPSLARS